MGGRGNGRGHRGRQNGNIGRNGGGQDVNTAIANLQIGAPVGGDAGAMRGGGRGGTRGGARGRLREVNLDDVIHTKPEGCSTKRGKLNPQSEKTVDLVANFYQLKAKAFSVFHYSVHFKTEMDIYNQTGRKRYLLGQLKDELPRMRLFTGDSIFTAERLKSDEIIKTAFLDAGEERIPVEITIKLVKMVQRTDPGYIQVLNHVNDQQLRTMGLSNVGRSHFDIAEKKVFTQHRLEIWPGISSTIRWQERELMLKVELTNKVVRQDTAYDTLGTLRGDPIKCKQALLGATVVTSYNNDKTYRIDDIDFTQNPENGKVVLL